MKALEGRNLTCAYSSHDVLTQLSIAARLGEVLGLIGPNGVGKTTLLRCLARLLPPRRGKVVLGEQDLWHMTSREVARNLALAPQDNLNWPLTVEQVVALGRAPHCGWLLPLSTHDRQIIAQALQRMGLWVLRECRLTELSGGEQKRVILARALCQEPRVLLLDEPTAYLDLKYQGEILALVQGLAHQDGMTIIATMHDLNQAALYADRLALLMNGKLLAIGNPRMVLTETNLSWAYGVPVMVAEHPIYHTPLITPVLRAAPDGQGRGG